MGTNLYDSNIDRMGMIEVIIDPVSLAANTVTQQFFTVPGLMMGDMIIIHKPLLNTGVTITNPRVSAANTISITFGNHTATAIDPPSELYQLLWFRSDAAGPFPGGLPAAVAI